MQPNVKHHDYASRFASRLCFLFLLSQNASATQPWRGKNQIKHAMCCSSEVLNQSFECKCNCIIDQKRNSGFFKFSGGSALTVAAYSVIAALFLTEFLVPEAVCLIGCICSTEIHSNV